MRIQGFLFITVFVAALVPSRAAAQHEAHQATTSPSPEMAQCVQAQPTVQNIITAATTRLESARQSNSPADMRAAIENFETALRDLRTQLAPCATAAAAPHAGDATPGAPSTPAAGAPPARPKPAPTPAEPHAGHTPPSSPAARGAPPAKPPSKPAESAPAHQHAGRASEPQPGQQRDPVNGLIVDPATAPKTTYQGQTYYFSSEESRKQFLANPAKFAKTPKR